MYARLIPARHVKVMYQTDITFKVETDIINPRFTWYRNHVKLVGEEQTLTLFKCEGPAEGFYRVDIEGIDPDDGNPTAVSSTQTFLEIIFSEDEYPSQCELYYYHDIDGGVFSYMHWWVHDDILNGIKHGVDWVNNPTDPIFKYPCHVAYIAFLVKTFSKVYIQESRNGKILAREQFARM